MPHGFMNNPALVVALALAAGVVAQTIARHLRMPGIVLLLGVGVVLGPDLIGVIDPVLLGQALDILIGFSVAVILFDGGLNLNLKRMRGQSRIIQRLLSLGVVVTVAGASLATRSFMGWGWTPSLLFGTLVIVTGPTVVTPLLRRIKVRRSLETILETEGVLIDALGAVVAVVALEIVLGESFAAGALSAPARLAVGFAAGAVGGGLMGLLLRWRAVVPEGFSTIFTLSFTLVIYQVSNAIVPESGIMAAIIAGVVVGNANPHSEREIREFKEQLTTLLIGMLFVLLAADVRVAQVVALGWPGLLVVLALVFVVRPLSILLCTMGSDLGWRDKVFLSWVAPRGIVAAAVASLFATRLNLVGQGYGEELRALVFLVIAVTVVLQGMSAEMVARLLGVQRPGSKGIALLGAQPLGRLLARLLQEHGQDVVLIDVNSGYCREAEAEKLPIIFGNGLADSVILRSQMDTRRVAAGVTHNEGVNLLFARKMREDAKVPFTLALGEAADVGITAKQFIDAGVRLIFGNEIDSALWSSRIQRGTAVTDSYVRQDETTGIEPELPHEILGLLLPLFVIGDDDKLHFVDERTRFTKGKRIIWLRHSGQEEQAGGWLLEHGWTK